MGSDDVLSFSGNIIFDDVDPKMSELIFYALFVGVILMPIIIFFVFLIYEDVDDKVVYYFVYVFILIIFLLVISSAYWLPIFVQLY